MQPGRITCLRVFRVLMPLLLGGVAHGQACSLSGYHAGGDLTAHADHGTTIVLWKGEGTQENRIAFALEAGKPVIRELAVRASAGTAWQTLGTNLQPEFDIVVGRRRITEQQLLPLKDAGVPITDSVVDEDKWEAFWDAPLSIPGSTVGHLADIVPPTKGVRQDQQLPRSVSEIERATVHYQVKDCSVRSDGDRMVVSFPGASLGVFHGALQFTVYGGSNLIRQEMVASTEEPSVAYLYRAGVSGFSIAPDSSITWRDVANTPQAYHFGGIPSEHRVTVQAANRLLAVSQASGSVAVFPSPHNFFWAREISVNLGYNWYRQDSAHSFAVGIEQPEREAMSDEAGRGSGDYRENFALLSARPGSQQHMPLYLYLKAADGEATLHSALTYTRGDHFKPLPGYQVMATHFHEYFVKRARARGDDESMFGDFEVARATGVNIFAPIDGGAGGESQPPLPDQYVRNLQEFYRIAKLHSDENFFVMPNLETTDGELPNIIHQLGGHWDLLMPHPVYFSQGRAPSQPLVEQIPGVGNVYRIGSADDFMEMVHREKILVYMPHPRSKGSTGFPDIIRNTTRFKDDSFRGIGIRWGMGLDGSERRLCEYRCLPLLDEMNNWIADLPAKPKYTQAISELYQQGPGDDFYANNPVNYVKLAAVPKGNDWSSITEAMDRGDYFFTSGEVLIPSYSAEKKDGNITVSADVEWTFPLDFVEVVYGDGNQILRREESTADLLPNSKKHFTIQIPLGTAKWVRFAAWDSAGDGALVQPVKLN